MKWNVGDEVYSVQTYTGVTKGKITKLLEEGAYIHFSNLGGNGGARYDNMFLTEEEARKAMHDKSEKIANGYREKLKTKEDVLKFIFENCGSWDEYTDNEANEVGLEKVKEFFGVTINF